MTEKAVRAMHVLTGRQVEVLGRKTFTDGALFYETREEEGSRCWTPSKNLRMVAEFDTVLTGQQSERPLWRGLSLKRLGQWVGMAAIWLWVGSCPAFVVSQMGMSATATDAKEYAGSYTGSVCADGWESTSTGSGTCSWHGGVAYTERRPIWRPAPQSTAWQAWNQVADWSMFVMGMGWVVFMFGTPVWGWWKGR